jgi:hypothetical protein
MILSGLVPLACGRSASVQSPDSSNDQDARSLVDIYYGHGQFNMEKSPMGLAICMMLLAKGSQVIKTSMLETFAKPGVFARDLLFVCIKYWGGRLC